MTDWSKFTDEARKSVVKRKLVRDSLTPDEREVYDRYLEEAWSTMAESEEYGELNIRRKWAAAIREKFGKLHIEPHSGKEGCGACGAIQAANFMDPDYVCDKDGPEGERL